MYSNNTWGKTKVGTQSQYIDLSLGTVVNPSTTCHAILIHAMLLTLGLCELLLRYQLWGSTYLGISGHGGFNFCHILIVISVSTLSWIADVWKASHVFWNKDKLASTWVLVTTAKIIITKWIKWIIIFNYQSTTIRNKDDTWNSQSYKSSCHLGVSILWNGPLEGELARLRDGKELSIQALSRAWFI